MRNHEPFPSFSLSLSLSLLFSRSLSFSASPRHSPSLSLILSPFHSLSLSPFSPQPRFSLPFSIPLRVYTCTRTYSPPTCAHVRVYAARVASTVWRFSFLLLLPPSFLFTRSSPPKQIVKTASAFVVIGRSFPKNQWPLVDHAVLSFLSTWPKRIT